MEKDVLEQRARAFDYLFDAVVVTDLQGMIIDWNHGSESLYGYTRDEALNQPVSMLHVPEDVEHITAEVLDAVGREGRWTGEVRMLHKNGSQGWIESVCIPLLDDDGQMIGALGINRDISERKLHQERLFELAHYDQLTGLPNRHLLIERLEQAIASAKRHKSIFGLLFLDMDNFKEINDQSGHARGDQALQHVAQCLKESLRETDTVARIGGDEFVVLLHDIGSAEKAESVAEYLVNQLRQACRLNDLKHDLTVSIGIATYPENGETTDELLSASDQAMYRAKQSGKNTCEF
jgi:diguanylate cyclase (GGDEF)-like protein/PAS domain S-box-containing protein